LLCPPSIDPPIVAAFCWRRSPLLPQGLISFFLPHSFLPAAAAFDCGLIFTSGLIFTIFSKFFVALYLGHIETKSDESKAFFDQLVELNLISPNTKCFGQVSKN
jgi:hypothetical protein